MSNEQFHDRVPHFWIVLCLAIALIAMAEWARAEVTVNLTWTSNTETDLAGYQMFRSLTPCAQAVEGTTLKPLAVIAAPAATYTDATVPATTQEVCYGIKAYDHSNNFSVMSELAGKAFARPAPVLIGHWDKKTDVPHDPKYNLKHYTIHALVHPKAALVGYAPILVKNYTTFFYASSTSPCGAGGVLAGHASSGRICDPTPVTPHAWNVLTATYDGTTLSIYRNKVLTKSGPAPVPLTTTEQLQIAGSKFNELCNCDLEVWWYDQAMTATEIASLPSTPTHPAVVQATPSVLTFTTTVGGPAPTAQSVVIANAGPGTFTWTAASSQPWLTVTPTTGAPGATMSVSVVRGTLVPGPHTGTVTVTAPGLTPVVIAVTFTVTPDVMPPKAPSGLKLSARPSADSALVAWTQTGGPPDQYRVDRWASTAWTELVRVSGNVMQAVVPLPLTGRRVFRVCALTGITSLCNDRDGLWVAR